MGSDTMDTFSTVTEILPGWLRELLQKDTLLNVQELRLRADRPPQLCTADGVRTLSSREITQREIENVLLAASDHSCYAVQDRISEGFLTVPGGHRIGVCGSVVMRGGERTTIKQISSLCIRLARQLPLKELPPLTESTLIAGLPGSGKTTLLRECIRKLSDDGACVGVSDERGEIAACIGGVPQLDVGGNTDVMTGGKKADNLLSMLRSMRPSWLAVDEITAPEDLEAIALCSYCGVRLLATAHAKDADELRKRPLYRRLLALSVFRRIAVLDGDKSWSLQEVE